MLLRRETCVGASVLLVAGFVYLHDRRIQYTPMFFKKAHVPNLTNLLSNSLNKTFEAFEQSVFKDSVLDSEQKVELACYLLFFQIHAMLVREVPNDIVMAFPMNTSVLPMLTSNEKGELADKYQERMPEYIKILTEVEDKNSILNVALQFLSYFYSLSKDAVAQQKFPQLMTSEILASKSLILATETIDLCFKHNHVR